MNLNALAANIKTLDLSRKPAISDAERAYFRHYGLNFEERCEQIVHHFGHFQCARFEIVAHYFEHAQAKGSCFVVHGYFDHSGLYAKLIEFCLQRQLSVVIFDLPGHGLSTGERASIASFGDYKQALKSVLSVFDSIAPAPWYAIGQSTGGAILMDFILSGGADTFSKTVLLAPLYRPTGWKLGRVTHMLARWFVKRIRRKFVDNSNDQEFLKFLNENDPLQYRYLSLDWVSALKAWLHCFDKLPPSEYAPLVIQGKQDTTVDWRYNLPVIEQKFPNAKIFYLQQGRHHLVNESEAIRQKMYAAIDLYFDLFQPQASVEVV